MTRPLAKPPAGKVEDVIKRLVCARTVASRVNYAWVCTFAVFLLLGFSSSPTADAAGRRPNIVIILADDMGWGDPQCYNADSKIPTPGIDRLAQEGMKFTDAHTPSAVCTPTRYGLLTGRYCWRSRLKSSVLDGFSPPLIEADRVTIASFLKQAGYATACIGKWHLGMQWTRKDGSLETTDREGGFRTGENIDLEKPVTGGPLDIGFDHFFGISASLDMPPYCWIKDDRCSPIPTSSVPTATDTIFLNQAGGVSDPEFRIERVLPKLQQHATDWIRKQYRDHPEQPFFLYLPLNSPHLPVAPSRPFRGKSGAGDYGDFVVETDHCVGSILQTLDETDQDQNTVVLFTSDNGGLWHSWDPVEVDDVANYRPTPRGNYTREYGHQSNAHLRGTKADIWEGGHRVPFLIRWPQQIPAGKVCDQLVELNDTLATIARIVDEPLPTGAAEDSRDLTELLWGGKEPVRDFAIHHSLRGEFAIRMGKWKLIEHRGSGGFSRPRQVKAESGQVTGQLYDLSTDPSESRNVWSENPTVVRRLDIALGDVVDPLPRERIEFTSSIDGSTQAAMLILPRSANSNEGPIPMVVSLHSWSADLNQRNALERLVHDRGWVYLFPNFRGVNRTPEACGSPLAQQDILDAVDWVAANHSIDQERIYLTGTSGGGHMTMLMAGRHARRWRAASAWVGISDLTTWHARHQGSKYGNMLESCTNGAPGDSPEVDAQYKSRSPLTYLAAARDVPIDIAAGVHDGHAGSVPVRQSIRAFNAVARANGSQEVSDEEMRQISRVDGRLDSPRTKDIGFDSSFGRDYYLRRHAGKARLTIFEGGHEGIATATMDWFEKHP